MRIFSLSHLVKSFEEKIQPSIDSIDIASITPCESYKYIFSYILNDRIIGFWCLNNSNIQFNVFCYN